MKKLLTLFLAAAMLMGLAGCKEKTKTVTVNIYGPGASDPDVFTVNQKADTIKDVLDLMSTPSVFECTYEQINVNKIVIPNNIRFIYHSFGLYIPSISYII